MVFLVLAIGAWAVIRWCRTPTIDEGIPFDECTNSDCEYFGHLIDEDHECEMEDNN